MKLRKKEDQMKNKEKTLFIELSILIFLCIFLVGAQEPFNLEVEIAQTHKTINPGEHVWFTTKIMNLGRQERTDITLEYEVLNKDKELVAKKTETVAIETQASFVSNLKIPEKSSQGPHTLEVSLKVNENEEAKGSSSFNVVWEKQEYVRYVVIGLIIVAVLVILMILVIKSKKFIEEQKVRSQIHNIVKKKLTKKSNKV